MSRTETDREDLMAEAVALVRRIEFAVPGRDESVVCGFRRDGGFSVYLGQDPVFHFDAALRLRRAFRGGKLYRTQGDTLAELTRNRGESTTTLVRRDLPPAKLAEFLDEMRATMRSLQVAVAEGRATVQRRVPEQDADRLADVGRILTRIVDSEPALAPAIAGKR
jgi:hypothetical protein